MRDDELKTTWIVLVWMFKSLVRADCNIAKVHTEAERDRLHKQEIS